MEKIVFGAAGTPEEERNRKLVLGLYEVVLNGKQFERWPEFLDPGYIQHKPNVPTGPQGVLDFMSGVYKQFPHHRARIVRCLVDGDYVMLHVHVMLAPQARDIAVMDIFRIQNGKIIEHWDVDQPVPDTFAHSNGMF